jgi:hypothetical protein
MMLGMKSLRNCDLNLGNQYDLRRRGWDPFIDWRRIFGQIRHMSTSLGPIISIEIFEQQ